MLSEHRAIVSVHIDQAAWDEAAKGKAGTDGLLGWALVIAGESIMEGQRSGPVFLGCDNGRESPHVGTWEAY